MVGIGIAPEGIETNYVLYELMLEMGWRNTSVETQSWLKEYTTRRYGAENTQVDIAWEVSTSLWKLVLHLMVILFRDS
jgi:alpha-N-acetylglucosaminidase